MRLTLRHLFDLFVGVFFNIGNPESNQEDGDGRKNK